MRQNETAFQYHQVITTAGKHIQVLNKSIRRRRCLAAVKPHCSNRMYGWVLQVFILCPHLGQGNSFMDCLFIELMTKDRSPIVSCYLRGREGGALFVGGVGGREGAVIKSEDISIEAI